MTIGERIKQRRKELNLSVDELSQKLGKNRATIYRYENNEIENFPITVLEPLAQALETTPYYLMGWFPSDEPDTIFDINYIYTETSDLSVKQESESETLNKKDQKEISAILENTKQQLMSQNGLLFDGDPASPEAIQSILDAMQIGMEMAKLKNKEKYTPKKYKRK